ncbi:MAG: hypothetical protein ABL857_08890 [Rickettsiales bacterium]|jgi:hypothetical protein
MQVIRNFFIGIFSVLKITSSSLLYRYPYRNSAEGLHKDWLNIGGDIRGIINKLEENDDGNRRQ